MKAKIFILVISFFYFKVAHAQESVLYPDLKKQIDSLSELDKKASKDMVVAKKSNIDSLRLIFRKVTVNNTSIIKEIFNKYGFLNYDMIGKGGSANFWLMVQHADNDVPFQEAVLQKMKEQVLLKKANATNFAYLTDRVNINTGKPQIYGTQLTHKDGKVIPKNMIEPENVDNRRKEIGMGSLEDYLKLYKQMMTKPD